MKRNGAFLLALLAITFPAWADEHPGDGNHSNGGSKGGGNHSAPAARPVHATPARNFHPVHIDLSHSSSGTNNHNFNQASQPAASQAPTYSQVHWNRSKAPSSRPEGGTYGVQTHNYQQQQQNIRSYAPADTQVAAAVHHHPYTAGYVRQRLQKIGVKKEPGYITDRQEIIDTDRVHSTIRFPQTGPDGGRLSATAISSRHYNDPAVRAQMKLVFQDSMRQRVVQYNQIEIQHDHYYWHKDSGFNYCHYVDNWGYHWYGWYAGSHYFWTRNYANRWWWYDTDYNRWCFWNNNFWWWQDPAHVGDLYCYNDDAYVPCNSAEDQIVVTVHTPSGNGVVYNSQDGTRQVKVMGDSQDAFLYDTSSQPSFAPIYLASKVSNVQFSTNSGRPLEIVLSLGDGTFDMFDAQGNTYNPGNNDADQDAQDNSGVAAPPEPPNTQTSN